MAKTSYLDISTELEETYYKDLQSGDRFIIPRIRPKKKLLSRERVDNISERSYLQQCSELWDGLSDAEKQNWHDYDFHPQQHGWRRFVEEQSIRINLDLEGTASPDQYHQGMVGKILIESPAEETKLIQVHPASYWVYRKVEGKDSMYEPVEVDETLSLPFEVGLSYKSDLTSTGAGSFARFYATVRHHYQGQNLDYDLIVDIPLSSGWDRKTSTLSETGFEEEPKGKIVSYHLYIHLYKVTGTLLFDHILSQHSATNWARDPYCDRIDEDFTRAFYQIPKAWAVKTLPEGADYESVYPYS